MAKPKNTLNLGPVPPVPTPPANPVKNIFLGIELGNPTPDDTWYVIGTVTTAGKNTFTVYGFEHADTAYLGAVFTLRGNKPSTEQLSEIVLDKDTKVFSQKVYAQGMDILTNVARQMRKKGVTNKFDRKVFYNTTGGSGKV